MNVQNHGTLHTCFTFFLIKFIVCYMLLGYFRLLERYVVLIFGPLQLAEEKQGQ